MLSNSAGPRLKLAYAEGLDVLGNVENRLLEQRRTDLLEKGEHLSLLCCGETGAGKTSLLNALFDQKISYAGAGGRTVSLVESKTMLSFANTQLKVRLTTVDTVGYGDSMDLGASFERVTDYISSSFRRAIERERRADRPSVDVLDETVGVDAVLYFISPHRLKDVDCIFMRRLAPLASIIPIIAKADTYTRDELRNFRERITRRLHEEGIEIAAPPFAVISTEPRNEHDETRDAPGRTYPWGTAPSENEDVSDVPALRRFLLTDGLMKLHEKRRSTYESFRQNLSVYRMELAESITSRVFTCLKTGGWFCAKMFIFGFIAGKAAHMASGNSSAIAATQPRPAERDPVDEEEDQGPFDGIIKFFSK